MRKSARKKCFLLSTIRVGVVGGSSQKYFLLVSDFNKSKHDKLSDITHGDSLLGRLDTRGAAVFNRILFLE